jgi:hypothetical protein
VQEIDGRLYHVSVDTFELFGRDIKVLSIFFLRRTDLHSLSPSGSTTILQGISLVLLFVRRLLRIMVTYKPHQIAVHLTGHKHTLDILQIKMWYSHLLNLKL